MERCLEFLLMSAGQMEIVEGGAVGAQLVGDYQPGCEALLPERLAHEPQSDGAFTRWSTRSRPRSASRH